MSEHFTRPTRSLAGRVAIVTGAGTAGEGIGNGRAAAILLAEAGCSVVCVDLKEELASKTVEMIDRDGFGRGIALKANVADEEDCRRVVETAVGTYDRLDILINTVVSISYFTRTAFRFLMVSGHWWSNWNRSRSRHGAMDKVYGSQCFVYGYDGEICYSRDGEE